MTTKDLRCMLKNALLCADKPARLRALLCSAHLHHDGSRLSVVSTDTYQILHQSARHDAQPFECILHADQIKDLLRHLTKTGPFFTLQHQPAPDDDSPALLRVNGTPFACFDGTYVNYHRWTDPYLTTGPTWFLLDAHPLRLQDDAVHAIADQDGTLHYVSSEYLDLPARMVTPRPLDYPAPVTVAFSGDACAAVNFRLPAYNALHVVMPRDPQDTRRNEKAQMAAARAAAQAEAAAAAEEAMAACA